MNGPRSLSSLLAWLIDGTVLMGSVLSHVQRYYGLKVSLWFKGPSTTFYFQVGGENTIFQARVRDKSAVRMKQVLLYAK